METSGPTLEPESKPGHRAPSRGMLGRIRQATSDFDFTALLSGTKPESHTVDVPPQPIQRSVPPLDRSLVQEPASHVPEAPPQPAANVPSAPAPEPVAYNPFLIEGVAVPSVAEPKPSPAPAPESTRPSEDLSGLIQFNQSFSQPAMPAATPLTGPMTPTAQPARSAPAPVVYSRPAASLPAAMTRLTLFLAALVIGGVVGGGIGALLEWVTPIRVLSIPKTYVSSAPPVAVAPAEAPAPPRRVRRSARRSAHPATAAPVKPAPTVAVVKSGPAPNALESYKRYLLIPVGLLLLAGLFWICGGPEALGEFEDVGYWGAASASLALAILCGMLATMVTLDLRAANAPQPAARQASAIRSGRKPA
jgi:hypothetical protein